jgi:hypothetical protein
MANVFISYAREDTPIATHLSEMLQKSGHTVFYDQGTLVTGESFSKEVAQALTNAEAVVVVLSRHCKRSKWVEEELRTALEKSHRVIPVLLGQDATNNWVWPLISDRHAIRVESPEEIHKVAREITRSVE